MHFFISLRVTITHRRFTTLRTSTPFRRLTLRHFAVLNFAFPLPRSTSPKRIETASCLYKSQLCLRHASPCDSFAYRLRISELCLCLTFHFISMQRLAFAALNYVLLCLSLSSPIHAIPQPICSQVKAPFPEFRHCPSPLYTP